MNMITTKNRLTKIWVDKGAESAGEWKNMQNSSNTNLLYNEGD